jgi:hypothetical protein
MSYRRRRGSYRPKIRPEQAYPEFCLINDVIKDADVSKPYTSMQEFTFKRPRALAFYISTREAVKPYVQALRPDKPLNNFHSFGICMGNIMRVSKIDVEHGAIEFNRSEYNDSTVNERMIYDGFHDWQEARVKELIGSEITIVPIQEKVAPC